MKNPKANDVNESLFGEVFNIYPSWGTLEEPKTTL